MISHFETVTRSDVGRVRHRNEDSALLLQWEMFGEQAGGQVALAAVADGMGGHANGNIASKMALRALSAALVQGLSRAPLEGPELLAPEQLANMLAEAVAAAAQQLIQAEQYGLVDMGTTLCGALFVGSGAYIANVGDSRAYLIDGEQGTIQQITQDHSLVAQLVAKGELTPEEALVHPKRNEIYRMLGFGRQAQPDLFTLQLQAQDTLLLCSDGLTNMVSDEELRQMLSGDLPLKEGADRLIDLANSRGGLDNITLVAVRVHADPAEGR